MWTGRVFWINYARFKVTHTRLDTRKNQTIKTLESNKKSLEIDFQRDSSRGQKNFPRKHD